VSGVENRKVAILTGISARSLISYCANLLEYVRNWRPRKEPLRGAREETVRGKNVLGVEGGFDLTR
jgi:hypothetical protein